MKKEKAAASIEKKAKAGKMMETFDGPTISKWPKGKKHSLRNSSDEDVLKMA